MDDLDDEGLRDRLDEALGKAEEDGKAVRTLDAMLNEPQVLIPVDEFGEVLFAIIKEDTVVTVLPKGHGEEILQRGQALQQKVASGELPVADRSGAGAGEPPAERWEARRRRWREPGGPVVIERPRTVVQPEYGNGNGSHHAVSHHAVGHAPIGAPALPVHEDENWIEHAPTPERPDDPVGAALWDALERGSRRAAVHALHELLERKDIEDDLLPVWNEIAALGIPQGLRLGDLLEAAIMTAASASRS